MWVKLLPADSWEEGAHDVSEVTMGDLHGTASNGSVVYAAVVETSVRGEWCAMEWKEDVEKYVMWNNPKW